jgi:acyl-coenzyme A synthetase/AMP-(fatty) acid ligase
VLAPKEIAFVPTLPKNCAGKIIGGSSRPASGLPEGDTSTLESAP